MKVLIYVQHLVGIGHLRRAQLLARAINDLGMEAVVVAGGRPAALFPGSRTHQLPPAHCSPEDFSTILDENDRPVTGDWKRRRSTQLLEHFDREQPEVLVIETFPFGRRQFRFELLPLLERARGRVGPPRVVCSIRDVLQRRAPEREDDTVRLLNEMFDEVWVHGDPDWITLEQSFSRARDIVAGLRYTGYVSETWRREAPERPEGVVVSAGGGAAGAGLMRCAARARRLSGVAALPWRFLVGGDVSPEQTAGLAAEAGPGAVVEPVRPDFKALLAGCRVSISQLGYNTAVDLMQTGARAVVVPFEGRGETEQRTRAGVLARRGLVEVVLEADLSPRTLADAVDRAVEKSLSGPPAVSLDGAERGARWLAAGAAAGSR